MLTKYEYDILNALAKELDKFKENEEKFESTYSKYYNKTYKEVFDSADSICRNVTEIFIYKIEKIENKVSNFTEKRESKILNITEKIENFISNITEKIDNFISILIDKFKNVTLIQKFVEAKNKVVNKTKNKFKS